MPALTIKNIPDNLYEKLKESAKTHHRSLNSELIYCLETMFTPQKLTAAERIQRARSLRQQIDGEISTDDIMEAIDQGRA